MKNKKRLLAAFLSMVLLTGCGQAGTEIEKNNSGINTVDNQADVAWNTLTMKQQETFTDEAEMYLTGYDEGWIQEPNTDYDASSTSYASFCGDFCVLSNYASGQGDDFKRWNTMYYYDCDSKQTKIVDISYDLWEMSSDYSVAYLDIVSPGRIAFGFIKLKEGNTAGVYETEECKVVFYDIDKGADGIVDIMPALTQANVNLAYDEIFGASLASGKSSNIYLACGSKVVVMDAKGKFITAMEIPAADYVVYAGKSVSGEPLFYARTSSGGSVKLFCYDMDKKKIHELGEVKGYFSKNMAIAGDGTINYVEGGDIVAWNCLTGEKRKLINCKENGIYGSAMQVLLTCLSDGSLAILDTSTEELSVFYLTNEKLVDDCVITIDSVAYGWDLAKTTAAIYSRKTPGVTMEYTQNYEDDAYKVKLIADFIEGKGADIMIVPYEDFLPLYEKGLLADLSDVFDEETKTQVISQVWKPGTIDGKLFGLQDSNLYAISMIAPKKYMTKDGWTLDDIYRLMEDGKDYLQGVSPIADSRENLLYYLTILNLSTRFIDYKDGISKFDSDEFKKLLELCKNNKVIEDTVLYGGENKASEVKAGNYLGSIQYISLLASYGIQMNYYGPDYCYIGLPSDSGSGNMYMPSSILVVNKNTQHLDKIKDYLNMLYSKTIQRKEYTCVRKDVLRENVIKTDWGNGYAFDMGGGNYVQLETKSDGSTYIEDYIDFFENAEPIPADANEILSIVFEEVTGYFEGNADLDKTVKTIQNRVQLMLDEKK